MAFNPAWTFRDCPWCHARDVQMALVANFTTGGLQGQRDYAALSCPRCARVTVIESTVGMMDLASVMPRAEDVDGNIDGLPEDVATYLADAIKVLRVGVPDAAAVQLRKTLEAATTAKGANVKQPLVKRIQQLIADGHVSNVFDPALGYIRKIGNVGAHAGSETLTEAEVAQALDFTTLLLRTLFELPAQIAKLEAAAPPPPIDDVGSDESSDD